MIRYAMIYGLILVFTGVSQNVNADNLAKTSTGFYLPANMWHSESTYLAYGQHNPKYGNKCHLASDYGPIENAPVYAVANGVVHSASMSVGNYGGDTPAKKGGAIVIEHKTNTGQIFYALYGHVKNFQVGINDFVVAGQQIANVGPYISSGKSLPHLHFGINLNIPSYTGYTPTKACADYLGFIDPEVFLQNNSPFELPVLSRTTNPDNETNFDVYGIADKSIYGSLNLAGSFQDSAIVVRDFSERIDLKNQGNLDDSHRFLGGHHENQSDVSINGDNSYAQGDYLFVSYIKDFVSGEQRFGYPLKFSFIKEGDIIIDNDQKNANADTNDDIKNEPTYNGTIETDGAKVPGYFLTAGLHLGRSGDFAQWKPYKSGTYSIYVHIPKYNATAKAVRYIIKKDGTDTTAITSKAINQSANADKWVQIIAEDNSDTFKFDENGYIGLSLSNNLGTTNYADIDENQKVAFDAVKFVVTDKKALLVIRDAAASGLSVYKTYFNKEASYIKSYLQETGVATTIKWAGNVSFETMQDYDIVLYDDMGWCEDSSTLHYGKLTPAFTTYHRTGKPLYFIGDDLAFDCGNKSAEWFNLIGLTPSGNGWADNVNPVNELNSLLSANYGTIQTISYLADIDDTTAQPFAIPLLKTASGYDAVVSYKDSYGKVATQVMGVYASGSVISDKKGLASLKNLFKKSVDYLLLQP